MPTKPIRFHRICGLNVHGSNFMQVIKHSYLFSVLFLDATYSGSEKSIPVSPNDHQPEVSLNVHRWALSFVLLSIIFIRQIIYPWFTFFPFTVLLRIQDCIRLVLGKYCSPRVPPLHVYVARGVFSWKNYWVFCVKACIGVSQPTTLLPDYRRVRGSFT